MSSIVCSPNTCFLGLCFFVSAMHAPSQVDARQLIRRHHFPESTHTNTAESNNFEKFIPGSAHPVPYLDYLISLYSQYVFPLRVCGCVCFLLYLWGKDYCTSSVLTLIKIHYLVTNNYANPDLLKF